MHTSLNELLTAAPKDYMLDHYDNGRDPADFPLFISWTCIHDQMT